MSKIRKQIYLEPHQKEVLQSVAKSAGVSESEIIRQAIDQHIGLVNRSRRDLATWETEKVFIETLRLETCQQCSPLSSRRDWTRDELYGLST
jgi:Ribbon-helix-helix protein, copG family